MNKAQISAAFLCLLLTTSCSSPLSKKTSRDAAPRKPSQARIDNAKEAVPKVERKSKYGNPKSYVVFGKRYYVKDSAKGYVEEGIASWYGTKFHGRRTSSGEAYDMYAMTAAHKTLPLPTYARVTNLDNGRSVIVKINDRGPFHQDRIIDLSYSAAIRLGTVKTGTGRVEVVALDPRNYVRQAQAQPSEADIEIQALEQDEQLVVPKTYVQIGAFSSAVNAESLRKSFADNGIDNIAVYESVAADKVIHKVQIGPLDSAQETDLVVQQLSELGQYEYKIIIK